MASGSTRTHSRAVAPLGQSERAERREAGMPLTFSSAEAEWRWAVVMNLGLTEYQPR